MKTNLIVFNDGREPIVVSDENIKIGSNCYNTQKDRVESYSGIANQPQLKIIAQGFSQIDFNGLEETFDIVDVEKLWMEFNKNHNRNIPLGKSQFLRAYEYITAQKLNTKKFSERDVRNAIDMARKEFDEEGYTIVDIKHPNEIIQSLSKPYQIYDVVVEMEQYESNELVSVPNDDVDKPIYQTKWRPKFINGKIKILKKL